MCKVYIKPAKVFILFISFIIRSPFRCDPHRNVLLCRRAGVNTLQKVHNDFENVEELCVQGIRLKMAKYFAKATPIHYAGNHTLLNFSISHVVEYNDKLKKGGNLFNFSHPIFQFSFRVEGPNLQAKKKVNQYIIKTAIHMGKT